jgi:hypothetical protein
VPPSPTPLAPSGFVVLGTGAEIDRDPRQCVGARDGVIQQCAGQQLATVAVVDDVLGERLAHVLRDAALDLPLR